MTINRYLFQSPSSSKVQIGRLDPSVKQEDANSSASVSQQLNTSSRKTQPVHPTQVETPNMLQNLAPSVEDAQLLDVYA